MKPSIFIIGADKGGVGKTMLSRAFLAYLKANGFEHRAFDTESPAGDLVRFYPDKAEIVDLADSDGQMCVLDTLGAAVTVIDIRAGLLSPTLAMLAEIGFLDPERFAITVLHVIGSAQASIAEMQTIAARVTGARHVLVGNRINDTKMTFPAGAIDVPLLNVKAAEAVDQACAPFAAFLASDAASPVLRGYVAAWLKKLFAQFDTARLM